MRVAESIWDGGSVQGTVTCADRYGAQGWKKMTLAWLEMTLAAKTAEVSMTPGLPVPQPLAVVRPPLHHSLPCAPCPPSEMPASHHCDSCPKLLCAEFGCKARADATAPATQEVRTEGCVALQELTALALQDFLSEVRLRLLPATWNGYENCCGCTPLAWPIAFAANGDLPGCVLQAPDTTPVTVADFKPPSAYVPVGPS